MRVNRTAIFLTLLVLVVMACGVWFWRGEAKALVESVMEMLRTAGPFAFFGAMAVLPLAGFPLSPFTLAAGPVFGPQMGAGWVIVCAIGAVTVNVAVSYWLAAKALRPLVIWLLGKLDKKLPDVGSRSPWELTLILRVVPGTPFFLQSYLLGVARVPFAIYMVVSVLVPSVYIVGAVLAGDAFTRGDRKTLAVAGVLFAVVGLGMHLLRKQLQRKMRARKEAAASAES